MNKKKILLGILIAVWVCVIWGHSMQPAVVSHGESGKFLAIVSRFVPFIPNDENGMFIIRKAAHFTEYLILGTLLCMEFCTYLKGLWERCLNPLFSGLFVCFIDETIQLFVDGRSGEIRDMWIDFAGVALGTLIVLAIINNKKGRRY